MIIEKEKIRCLRRDYKGAMLAFLFYLSVFVFASSVTVISTELAFFEAYTFQEAAYRCWQCIIGVSILWTPLFFSAFLLQKASISESEIQFKSFFIKVKIKLTAVEEISTFTRALFFGFKIKEKKEKIIWFYFIE